MCSHAPWLFCSPAHKRPLTPCAFWPGCAPTCTWHQSATCSQHGSTQHVLSGHLLPCTLTYTHLWPPADVHPPVSTSTPSCTAHGKAAYTHSMSPSSGCQHPRRTSCYQHGGHGEDVATSNSPQNVHGALGVSRDAADHLVCTAAHAAEEQAIVM